MGLRDTIMHIGVLHFFINYFDLVIIITSMYGIRLDTKTKLICYIVDFTTLQHWFTLSAGWLHSLQLTELSVYVTSFFNIPINPICLWWAVGMAAARCRVFHVRYDDLIKFARRYIYIKLLAKSYHNAHGMFCIWRRRFL